MNFVTAEITRRYSRYIRERRVKKRSTRATRISFPAHVDSRQTSRLAASERLVNVHVVKRFDNTLHLPPLGGTKLASKLVETTEPQSLCPLSALEK